uniref:Uncharacterized protein n=1 Tax=Myoviridae sp. ctai52 TaxID=2825134 RepID=A0A8S5VFM2_9CAUD|nr:MAG TPA: hypothetical protein [Myoviridae sp. ctai52]
MLNSFICSHNSFSLIFNSCKFSMFSTPFTVYLLSR